MGHGRTGGDSLKARLAGRRARLIGTRCARRPDGLLADGTRTRDRRQGELAGLPQCQDPLQPAENAGEAGHDQSVNGVGNPGAALLCQNRATKAGDLSAERRCLGFHAAYYN